MKHLFIFLFSLISFAGLAQTANSGYFTRVNDSTTYQSSTTVTNWHSQGYRDIYFNNQATTKHWDIWNGSSYDHVFDFGSAAAAWGSITGTLSDQTDLQSALDAKEDLLETVSTSTAGATITLDFTNDTQKIFVGDATFATGKAVAFSNATSAQVFSFHFEVTNVAGTLNFPANVQMFDEGWDVGTTTWTPPATGEYEIAGSYDGTNWRIKRIGPYDTTPTGGGATISDAAYAGSWDANTTDGASKNALYDKIEALQPLDATLTALAGLATGSNKIPYSTGTDTFGQVDLSTDGTFASNSDSKIPTEKAVKTFFDANALAFTPADELTEIAGLSLETDITQAQLLTALGIITYVTIHADANTGITLTSHPNSVQAFGNDSKSYIKLDTRLLAQMRLSARVFSTSASTNNPRLYIQYSTNGGSSYTTLGVGTIASGDAISLFTGATTVQNTNWISLPSEAQANDLIWRVAQDGGNGSASPVVGNVIIQCKY